MGRLAKNTETSAKDASQLTAALLDIITESLASDKNVAIPGFGTWESEKTMEYVDTDKETGNKTLFPPRINVTFKPGSRLKKNIANS